MTVFLAIGPPPYELPLAVADSATELGDLLGLSCSTVSHHANLVERGSVKNPKYIKVSIEEEEDE